MRTIIKPNGGHSSLVRVAETFSTEAVGRDRDAGWQAGRLMKIKLNNDCGMEVLRSMRFPALARVQRLQYMNNGEVYAQVCSMELRAAGADRRVSMMDSWLIPLSRVEVV